MSLLRITSFLLDPDTIPMEASLLRRAGSYDEAECMLEELCTLENGLQWVSPFVKGKAFPQEDATNRPAYDGDILGCYCAGAT